VSRDAYETRGRVRHAIGDIGPHEAPGDHEELGHNGQRSLEAEHPHGRLAPLGLLRLRRMRRVIRTDHIDRAVDQGVADRLDIGR